MSYKHYFSVICYKLKLRIQFSLFPWILIVNNLKPSTTC